MVWRVFNTMVVDYCEDALEEAISCYSASEIFNTDQGTHLVSEAFTCLHKAAGIQVIKDSKGRWVDNIFLERLRRRLKYEEMNLKAYETVAEARQGIGIYFRFYNRERRQQSLERQLVEQAYEGSKMRPVAA